MKKFTFPVTGASPFDGQIVIVAKTRKTAQKLADNVIKEYNEGTSFSHISLYPGIVGQVPFDPPCVVHFESGES